jgi:hypothetical protein
MPDISLPPKALPEQETIPPKRPVSADPLRPKTSRRTKIFVAIGLIIALVALLSPFIFGSQATPTPGMH